VTELYNKDPEMSALNTFTRSQRVFLITVFVLLGLLFYLNFSSAAVLVNVIVTLAITGVLLFKFLLSIVGLTIPPVRQNATAELDESSLPLYTILVPMYQESSITITNLAENLQKLDYPLHQLDIKMVVEADDDDTIDVIKRLALPSFFEIVRVPPSEPRTKPKACNYALKFSRGEFVTIYDAEDQPEPGQLKLAIKTFRDSNDKLACIQCALNYYNSRENWLTRMFTMEYTFWFDLMLPAMSRLRIPIPLGGTSNHFRTDFLKQMVAWDPYNVTEDADLGIRMNRLGYESKVIASTTWEEATSRVISWIKQRTRWLKGYMQTYLVHLRRPLSLYRDFGWVNFIAYHLFIGGTVFSSLVNLLLFIVFLITVVAGFDRTQFLFPSLILECALFNLVVGNLLLMLLHLLAIWRRKMYDMIPFVITVPIYWLLASIASYRALYQLFVKPFYWDKTQHGVSKYFDTDQSS
jgi:cellulose synthase/poly-beta-1,6-N-acetylglucosamine synthase-like glycosyltransferase